MKPISECKNAERYKGTAPPKCRGKNPCGMCLMKRFIYLRDEQTKIALELLDLVDVLVKRTQGRNSTLTENENSA